VQALTALRADLTGPIAILITACGECCPNPLALINEFSVLLRGVTITGEQEVAKKKSKPREYTKDDVKLLKAHSKARTPVAKLSKLMKRSEGSLRQKARTLGIGLGHQR
jgi:hypothetical protein